MKDYSDAVAEARIERKSWLISNASVSHASELAHNLFQLAIDTRQDVRIVSGCLEAKFYNDLCEKAAQILESGNTIDIITEGACDATTKNGLSQMVAKSENGRLWTVDDGDTEPFFHFILVGSDAWRLETSHERKEAKANFNDPVIGAMLASQFCALLEHCVRVDDDSAATEEAFVQSNVTHT